MSDDFIPFNQSTPVPGKWKNHMEERRFSREKWHRNEYQRFNQSTPVRGRPFSQNEHQIMGPNNQYNNGQNRWRNNAQRNNSFKNKRNNFNENEATHNINAYLHPSMLQDPWAHLEKKPETKK